MLDLRLPDGRRIVEFHYEVVRAWERPVQPILAGSLGHVRDQDRREGVTIDVGHDRDLILKALLANTRDRLSPFWILIRKRDHAISDTMETCKLC